MKPLAAHEIRGNWATLLSVWNVDGSLDLGRMGVEIDALIDADVDGIYSNGTAARRSRPIAGGPQDRRWR